MPMIDKAALLNYIGANVKYNAEDPLGSYTALLVAINDAPEVEGKPLFIKQLNASGIDTKYDAGIICAYKDHFIIGYESSGAEKTFSIGQPIYDKDKNLMGWLGIGLYRHLYYSEQKCPVECWRICYPTRHCIAGKKVYTYWQVMADLQEDGDE